MKTKAKLTLAISVMSAVVLAAGVTSTFAWFTTNSSATANFATLNVESPSTIKIAGYQVTFNGSAPATPAVAEMDQTQPNVVTGTNVALGAVSSKDGTTFYAPTSILDDETNPNTLTFAEWSTVTAGNNKYKSYVKYNLAVTLEKTEVAKAVNVKVVEAASGSHVLDWYRVAVYETTAAANALETTSALTKKDGGFEKVFGHTAATASDSYVAQAGVASASGVIASDRTVAVHDSAVAVSGFSSLTNADVTKCFVVAVFLEGTAAARQNEAGGENLAISLRFEYAA